MTDAGDVRDDARKLDPAPEIDAEPTTPDLDDEAQTLRAPASEPPAAEPEPTHHDHD